MTLEEKGFYRMLRSRGRDLKVLSGPDAGVILRATVNRIGAFDQSTDLGDNPRGKRFMETKANGIPQLPAQGDLQDVLNNERFRVVEVGLDCPSYSKKFALLQLEPALDQ